MDDLHANDKDGSGDLSQKEFKKIIRTATGSVDERCKHMCHVHRVGFVLPG